MIKKNDVAILDYNMGNVFSISCALDFVGLNSVITDDAEIIDKAKATCQTLGFEQGTDKFSDCTLKLYSQEIDNKVALEVAKQKSSSSSSNSGTMVIYDPVRDKQNKIDKGMEMITGRCTLGSDC